MRLLLWHPGPARLDCKECVRYVTDLDRGVVMTYRATNEAGERVELPQVRHPSMGPPPCVRCPKESPERAHLHELSEKNWAALAHYRQAKAVGVTDEERADPIVRRNFALIDAAYQGWEMQQSARLQAGEFAQLFRR